MNAIAIDRTGGPDVLLPRELPAPEPAPGTVLVRVEAAGVNFIDVYYRTGMYPVPALPHVPGSEGAGTVERCGEGVAGFAPGDRVAWAAGPGSYAQLAAVPAAALVAVPEGVATRAAAAVMLQGMTAHYLCASTFPLREGHVAIVHAGAGGVGLLLTQLAKARGATVIATVSTDEKAALSRGAGADHVVRYDREDFAAEARRLTAGAGVDVVYDSVGLTTWERSLAALRPRGTFVLYGASSGAVPPLDLQTLNAKGSLFATRPTLRDYVATREELTWRAGELFAAMARGSLDVRIGATYPLADAARAHADLEARRTTGKLLLLP